jgi:hypothetical protein
MDLSLWLDLLSTGIPSGAIMFAGLFALAIAHGGFGVKMEGKSKQRLNTSGFTLFFLGFILTFFIAIFQIWEKHTDSVRLSFSVLKDFLTAFPYKMEVSAFALAIFFALLFREKLSEFYRDKKFKLKSEFVLNKEKDKLNVLVDNISGEKINCHARISRIVVNGVEKKVKKYNPDGYYMRWDEGRQSEHTEYAVLTSGVSRIIYFLYNYGDKICFELKGNEGDALEFGKCDITIEYYRMKKGDFVKFGSFTGAIKTYLTDRKEAQIEIIELPKLSTIKKAIRFLDRKFT